MPKTIRAGLYTRVSTTAQADKHGSEYQREALQKLADQRGWTVYKVYSDEGHSGRKEKRPGLNALMNDLNRGKLDVVVVWRFDRLARSLAHLIRFLEECKGRNVDFVSYMEGIDTATPIGMAMFQIAGAFAELESNLARERVQAGMDNARRKGIVLGRPRSPITPIEAVEAVQRFGSIRKAAFALGYSPALIAKRLKTWRVTDQYRPNADEIPVIDNLESEAAG